MFVMEHYCHLGSEEEEEEKKVEKRALDYEVEERQGSIEQLAGHEIEDCICIQNTWDNIKSIFMWRCTGDNCLQVSKALSFSH